MELGQRSSVRYGRGGFGTFATGGRPSFVRRQVEEEVEKGKRNGQLESPDVGLLPQPPGPNWIDRWHHFAPVEDVRLRRGQHHHGHRHVRGTVDVLRVPEHRPDPVQGVRLHPAAQQ